MRLRILFGTLILVLGLALYALAVSALAPLLPAHWAAQALFYALAGILWIFPAARLTRWMQQAPPFRPPPLG
jgi:membrane protein implicated in regulation of membrane protease activity